MSGHPDRRPRQLPRSSMRLGRRPGGAWPGGRLARILAWLAPVLLGAGWPAAATQAEAGAAGGNPEAPPAAMRIQPVGDLFSLHLRNAELGPVLEMIAAHAGMALYLEAPVAARVSARLEAVTLPQALSRLLRGYSYALSYLPPSVLASQGADHENALWLYPASDPADADREPGALALDSLGLDALHPDPRVRARAVTRLGRLTLEQAAAPLSLALGDNAAGVRLEAVSTLAGFGGDRAAEALAAGLADPDTAVREESVYALADVGGEVATGVLERALVHEDADVRAAAVEALAELGGESVVLSVGLALYDPAPSVREQAAEMLGDLGGETARWLLHQALSDASASVRDTAAERIADLRASDTRQRGGH